MTRLFIAATGLCALVSCFGDRLECNATDCNGCCDDGECVAGTTDDACGLDGDQCVECPTDQECDIQELGGGICQAAPDASTDPIGDEPIDSGVQDRP